MIASISAAAAKAFGVGGQKSLHECVLSEAEQAELCGRLLGLIDADRILPVRLDPSGKTRRLGVALPSPDPAFSMSIEPRPVRPTTTATGP